MATQLLNINGNNIEVMSYLWSRKEIDIDSGRNLKGVMERDIVAHHPTTLKLTFPPQLQAERQRLINILDNPYLTVKCFSPKSGTIETHTMYHGDLESEIYWNIDQINGGEEIQYSAFSVDLVEY